MRVNSQKNLQGKPISIAATPNAEVDDLRITRRLLLKPWLWQSSLGNNAVEIIQNRFSKAFHTEKAFAYNTGRAALYSILKAAGVTSKHEVITQAYTCLAVAQAILWAKATPVYVDIKQDTYNTTPTKIKRAITAKTKAVILQNTFGLPSEIDEVIEVINKENEKRQPKDKILIIEDCAHALGAKYKGKKVGEWGDAAFFSFGQEKVVSCTQGGLALSKDPDITNRLFKEHQQMRVQPLRHTLRAVLHPLFWNFINRTYYFPDIPKFLRQPNKYSLGKGFVLVLRFLGLLHHMASPEKSDIDNPMVYKLSNAQSIMLENQLNKLARFNQHRRKIADIYNKFLPTKYRIISANHIYLRFPLAVDNSEEVARILKSKRIIPGNWYSSPVHPAAGYQLSRFRYSKGSCPQVEKAVERSLNLPTHIKVTEEDALRIAKLIADKLK